MNNPAEQSRPMTFLFPEDTSVLGHVLTGAVSLLVIVSVFSSHAELLQVLGPGSEIGVLILQLFVSAELSLVALRNFAAVFVETRRRESPGYRPARPIEADGDGDGSLSPAERIKWIWRALDWSALVCGVTVLAMPLIL